MTGDADAGGVKAGSLEAGALGADSLTVSADLLVGRAVVGPVSAGTAEVSGRLEAASVAAAGSLTANDPGLGRHDIGLRPILGADAGGGDADGKRDHAFRGGSRPPACTVPMRPSASLSVGSCGGC